MQLQTPVTPTWGWVLRDVAGNVHVEFWCMGWEVPLRHSFTHVILITQSFCRLLTKGKCQSLSCAQLFSTPWTAAHQAPLSVGFSGQECWSGLPFPSPGDLPDPGIEPSFLHCRQMLYHLSHQGNGLLFPPPGDLPNPGIEPTSPLFPAWTSRFLTTEPPGKPKATAIQILKNPQEEAVI